MQKICKRCSGTIFTGKRQRCQNCSRLDKLVAKHGITFKDDTNVLQKAIKYLRSENESC